MSIFVGTSFEYIIEEFMKQIILLAGFGLLAKMLAFHIWDKALQNIQNSTLLNILKEPNLWITLIEVCIFISLTILLFILLKKFYFIIASVIFFLLILNVPSTSCSTFPLLAILYGASCLNIYYLGFWVLTAIGQAFFASKFYAKFDSTKEIMKKLRPIFYYTLVIYYLLLFSNNIHNFLTYNLGLTTLILLITTAGLIFCDIQKIKQLGLDVINKDKNAIRSAILLSAFVLILDFGYSPLRIFIPWGWKKE